ncbi:MAG: hypothetical protein ACFFE4_16720 [Candidatus Thorarchaeota archaeon]
MKKKEDNVIEGVPLSDETEAELELGKKLLFESLDSVANYSKNMIGVTGTLGGLYSGLLKILSKEAIKGVDPVILFLPVVFFAFSAFLFTLAYFPRKKFISLRSPSLIMQTYKELVITKMRLSKIATIWFIISIIIMAVILIFII